ncbi:tRNA lysidine(34) synthetase TilS [Planctomicrobium sp. SH664]|uniref:tRNA lysidine(34) synthetase TilS n=1 Tax=Planctomicrobium sp. SH664 TaxID=3448125 RepID=UPI003F5C5DB4
MVTRQLSSFFARHEVGGGRILLGVSGGVDSVALLRGVVEVAAEHQLAPVVAHFDHALRRDSHADADWVRELCRQLGVPVHVERWNGLSPGSGSIEEVARARRYGFLERAAAQEKCRWVAVAHTADDQIETVLHQIVRGSGLRGASGMDEIRPLASAAAADRVHESRTIEGGAPAPCLLIRPCLNLRRTDLLDFLNRLGQDFREDPSNQSDQFTRNRIRHDVLPLLRSAVHPGVDQALLRLAAQARDAQETLESLASEILSAALLDQQPDVVRLAVLPFQGRPRGLIREAIMLLWKQQNWPRQAFGSAQLDLIQQMVLIGKPPRASFPGGVQATLRSQLLELRRQ